MDTLSPNQFGIAGAENMDSAPTELSCSDKVAQYCAGNPERCSQGATGLVVKGQNAEHFAESYPECAQQQATTTPLETTVNNTVMKNKDIFNIQSPNFLGGQNVHNLIIIILALLILVNTGGGNILTAPLKAAKKAV